MVRPHHHRLPWMLVVVVGCCSPWHDAIFFFAPLSDVAQCKNVKCGESLEQASSMAKAFKLSACWTDCAQAIQVANGGHECPSFIRGWVERVRSWCCAAALLLVQPALLPHCPASMWDANIYYSLIHSKFLLLRSNYMVPNFIVPISFSSSMLTGWNMVSLLPARGF